MVFTLVDAALFKPVPVAGGERLVTIRNTSKANGSMAISLPDFREYKAQAGSFEQLEAAWYERAVMSEQGNPPQSYDMARISSGLFAMLHTQPVLGRGFLPGEDGPGAAPVVLLGHGVWTERYGGSREVLGRVVRVNEKAATIVGVMPKGFAFPTNQNLWMPLAPTPDMENRATRRLDLFGMLKPGTSRKQGSADVERIASRMASEHAKEDKGVTAEVQTFNERYNGGNIRLVFTLMMAAVGSVLLIVCANVANMMLSRALGRKREMAIRAAMGATRLQLIRQLLTESLLLSLLGGVAGLALAGAGVHAFTLAVEDVGKPYWVQFSMDYVVFSYFAVLCVVSGILFGLAPALRSSRGDLNSGLKEGGRNTGGRSGGRLSGVLAVVQFALALVLLTGAGVFVRSVLENLSLNPFVPSGRILTARVRLPATRYGTAEARLRFFDRLLPRLKTVPGVTHAAIVSDLPGISAGEDRVEMEGAPVADQTRLPSASVLLQSPGYFAAVNLPILLGRDFNDLDGGMGREAAIVTREFAERYWPRQGAVGKRFRIYDGPANERKAGAWIEVIGVSADIVQKADEPAPDPLIFLPYRREGFDSMFLLVRSSGNASSITTAVRAAVQGLDEDLPLFDVRTLAQAVERNRWFETLFGAIFSIFGCIALVIAAVGIYAVIAQATSSRTQEIGVRVALGASSRSILGMVLARGAKHLAAGLLLGLAAAAPAARMMKGLPLRASPTDPVVFAAVSILLAGCGLFACWLPARQAARMDPVKAIRYE